MATSRRTFTPQQASTAFAALESELEQVPASSLAPIRVDPQRVAAIAHSVAARDEQTPRVERFAALSETGMFDLKQLGRLRTIALATWHARQQQLRQAELASSAALPEEVFREAQATRATMLRVLEYHLSDVADVAADLEYIRSGAGYQDLANDLQMLADLYEDPRVLPTIEEDARHYDAGDTTRARDLAAQIFRALGLGAASDSERWAATVKRCLSLLTRTYVDVSRAGHFAFSRDEDVHATYPSLVTSTRSRSRRRPGEDEDPQDPGLDPPVDPGTGGGDPLDPTAPV